MVRVAQQRALAQGGIGVCEARSFDASVGAAVLDSKDLFWLSNGGSRVLRNPEHALGLKFQLRTRVRMMEAVHRVAVPTLIRLQTNCRWKAMVAGVIKLVKYCLHSINSRVRERILRPYGDTVHGTGPHDVVHFDLPYVGDGGPIWAEGLPDDSE